ncbi:MAG TPA: ATP-binding protein [Nitrospirota bacterium]|nr:ATP-binding protein [Nitrospirota bacterium]
MKTSQILRVAQLARKFTLTTTILASTTLLTILSIVFCYIVFAVWEPSFFHNIISLLLPALTPLLVTPPLAIIFFFIIRSMSEMDALLRKQNIKLEQEVAERKQAEENLSHRNAFIETILKNLPIGLAVNKITNGKTIYLNDKFAEIYGWPKNAFVDVDKFFLLVYPDPARREEMKEAIMCDIASGNLARMRWENIAVTNQRGETKFVTAVNIPLFEQDLMISTAQDVSEQISGEKALAESEKRFKRLVESVTDYIYNAKVENGRLVTIMHGPGCMAVTGYSHEEFDADPNLWRRIIHPGDLFAVTEYEKKVLANRLINPLEYRIIHKDGTIRWVRNTVVLRSDKSEHLIDYDGLITDITPLKELEVQLRHAQKMEAVGQLAGGVAHDFNNILTAIIGYGNLLLMKLSEGDTLKVHVQHILASAERASHLTRGLLAFSRKQVIDLKPVDVNAIISQVEKLLHRVIGEDIEIKTRFFKQNLPVLADSVQIEQIIMNLATNSRDAMPNGGLLLIETSPFDMGEDFLLTHAYGKPGTYALIMVTDTGIGMDEDIRTKIFEPFFTTKEVGKGTGLGLAMVYGIVKQHNGYINVYSEPDRGTTFKIYLPLIFQANPSDKKHHQEFISRGTETVLLAEDDGEVRMLMRTVLKEAGYQVIEAVDGEDAIQKFRENNNIDLVVSDIIMPKINGKEMYQEIKKFRPEIKVIFTSGYTADIIHKKGVFDLGLDFVLKPVAPGEFLQRVRDVLDKNLKTGS